MSRRGNCFDNAPIESFWGTLKNELVYHRRFATREEARRAISEYIEMFCPRVSTDLTRHGRSMRVTRFLDLLQTSTLQQPWLPRGGSEQPRRGKGGQDSGAAVLLD